VNGTIHDIGNEDDENRLETSWLSRRQPRKDFHHARNGDHLMVPFECDFCVFSKLRSGRLQGQDPEKDALLMACIRRANLDAFWSRATSTVIGNGDRTRAALLLSESVGLLGPYECEGTLPLYDHCGYEVAIQMLLASRKPGKHSKQYSQWDTIRKIRTVHSNQFKATPQYNSQIESSSLVVRQPQLLGHDKCSSFWFSRFFTGCRRRMGQDWRPNKAMSTDMIVKMLRLVAQRIESALGVEEQHKWLTFGTYSVITYVLSLRGPEGLLVDIKGMLKYEEKGDERYFIVALLGKVKGEHQDRCHLLPCATTTTSGIKVKEWVKALINEKKANGCVDGPLFTDTSGGVISTHSLDDMLIEVLEEMYELNADSFPVSITSKDDINGSYQVFRTFRRSSDTRALEKNLSTNDINIVNRWHKIEQAKGGRPVFQMKDHYAQVEILLEPFIRYTTAM
jgi:hypothetical protein